LEPTRGAMAPRNPKDGVFFRKAVLESRGRTGLGRLATKIPRLESDSAEIDKSCRSGLGRFDGKDSWQNKPRGVPSEQTLLKPSCTHRHHSGGRYTIPHQRTCTAPKRAQGSPVQQGKTSERVHAGRRSASLLSVTARREGVCNHWCTS